MFSLSCRTKILFGEQRNAVTTLDTEQRKFNAYRQNASNR